MTEQKNPEKEKKVRVVWGSNENTPVFYANHIQVTHAGGTEYHITFGHLNPPLTFGLDESEIPNELVVKPLTTIVASPDVMKAFVEVLKGNVAQFEARMKEREEK
ncbi:MAG: DUF3467 domain-containing protein [Chloroflexota bacterium]